MHADAYGFVAAAVQQYQAVGPVYEIGARNINGTVRGLFPGTTYLGVDIVPGPDVDLVVDAATFVPPFPMATAVCCEVLEHTPAAEAIVARACAALEPGGLLILTCAGKGRVPHSAYDGGPIRPGEFYQNRAVEELAAWASDAGVEALAAPGRVVNGDVYFVGRKRSLEAAA